MTNGRKVAAWRWLQAAALLAVSLSASAGFEEGLAAYKRHDFATAFREFRIAAEQGHAEAQFNLGVMYHEGQGVPQDYAEAARWYRKAAEQGDAGAQFNLGVMYAKGQGVPQDHAEALRWYRKAAEQGGAGAQFNVGIMYETGQGVPQDYVRAYAWLNLAAAKGRQDSIKARDPVASRMTRAQVAEAQALSRKLQERIAAGVAPTADGRVGRSAPALTATQVRHVQEMLRALGYDPGPADGVAGPRTLAAVRAYQRQLKLPPTGRITAELIRLLEASVLAGRMASDDGARRTAAASGTGFMVDERGDVVTNAHVVSGCSRLAAEIDGRQLDATVVATDAANDLALVRIARLKGTPLTLRERPKAKLGERVVVAGYPLRGLVGGDLQIATGVVSGVEGPGNDRRLMQITAPVQAGNSGGPLLDSAGLVAGVVVAKLDAAKVYRLTGDVPQNVNFAIEAAVLRAFLELQGVRYQHARNGPERPVADIAETARHSVFPLLCWR